MLVLKIALELPAAPRNVALPVENKNVFSVSSGGVPAALENDAYNFNVNKQIQSPGGYGGDHGSRS